MRTALLLATLAAAGPSFAAIVPSWRVSPIHPVAHNADTNLVGAVSVSLMVSLSGGSKFSLASLRFDQSTFGGPFTVYNTPAAQFGSDHAPSPAFIPIFPQVEFDSYITTPLGAGGPAAFTVNAPIIGPDRFEVEWGASPPAGVDGTYEIARLTLRGPFVFGSTPLVGAVRDDLNPGLAIPVPNFPFAIPEPVSFGLIAVMILCTGARRR
jgi:hypothetical protein